MLLAVAPNPTLDRILYVPRMVVGDVHRATKVHLTAGSKGVNIGRVTRMLGDEVLVTGPLAGQTGQIFANLALAEGLPTDWYWLNAGETRTCLLINHDTGDATVINEPGPTVSLADWAGLVTHVKRLAQKARAVALAGSSPPGLEPQSLGRLARVLVASERAIYVDTSGAALTAILAQPEGLCIKVNQLELVAGLGLALGNQAIDRLVEAGQMLLDRRAALVVVTLGSQGALAITPTGAWQASTPPVELVSTVGSGDSLLAGLIVARLAGQSLEAALAFGVACGSANAMTDLPGRFERNQVEMLLKRVSVTRL